MKRFITALFAFALVFSFTGCGKATPTQTTEKFLKAVQKEDVTTAAKYYDGDLSQIDFADTLDDDTISDTTKTALIDLFCDFDYKINGEVIDSDETTATVTATLTMHNLSTLMTDTMTEYISQAFSLAFSDDYSEEKIASLFDEVLRAKIAENAKDYTDTVEIKLVKADDGTWKVADMSQQTSLYSVVFGGLAATLSRWSEAFSE